MQTRPVAGELAADTRGRSICRWLIVPIASGLISLAGCSSLPSVTVIGGPSMGTTWSVSVPIQDEKAQRALVTDVQAELDRLVSQMSHWDSDSDLSRFNRAPAGERRVLPHDLFEVLRFAAALSMDTGGAYDPTVGALVNLWGFGPRGGRVHAPETREIAEALAHSGASKLQLHKDTHSALQPGGVEIDLSSVAPGYAIDRIADLLGRRGISQYLIELGGELRAHGQRPGGGAWHVAIQQPPSRNAEGVDAQDTADLIALNDLSMGASGDYRHYFEDDGNTYTHTLDARDGLPVRHRLASVTVIAATCMQADATASALSVLGPDAGVEYARRHQLAALFIVRDDSGFIRIETPQFTALRDRQ